MLGIFNKALVQPPRELNSPALLSSSVKPKLSQEILEDFLSQSGNAFSVSFGNATALAYFPPKKPYSIDQRFFCTVDDIYCIFLGSLNNLSSLLKQYGLSKGSDEAMLVIEELIRSSKSWMEILADGSVVVSDDIEVIKASCGKSFAPFPTGCMVHSKRGLMSFEHPTRGMKAMHRVDSEGVMCRANFKVDVQSTDHGMPRVSSGDNWALRGSHS
ncbi:Stem-specific protein TSJT1 [Morella rubra]|uniref:Stem-specific protein TSJT1 n=1 Tax=Morella rubra TaxID=262757 RepID=A0A6A1WC87_9ROSI|nr:Stem-specific protein TSJT1 [Morella rubra]